MKIKKQDPQAGMALVIAVVFISVALIGLGALTARLMSQRLLVDNYESYLHTFQGLESAIIAARVDLEHGGNGVIGMENWEPAFGEDNLPIIPPFGEGGVGYVTMDDMPYLRMGAYAHFWENDGRDSNGDGIVNSPDEEGMIAIYAQAEDNGVLRRAEVVFQSTDFNVWRNAIFAGTGQAGGLINGNVSIHGSVHLLGDELPEGQTAIAAIDLSGTAMIRNNYGGMPNALRTRIPDPPMVNFEGETVESLGSELRVKNGLVGMSGNSHVGQPDQKGNSLKETVDGTFVTHGWTGNSVSNNGGRGVPSRVYSDNGWDELYDLGDRVSFPQLTDDWRDPVTGARVEDPSTGTWYTHEDYFNQVLLADPDIPDDGVFEGNLTINARNSPAIYWNANTEEYLTGAAALAATPAATDDFLQWNPNTKVLHVNGQIRINGNLTFTGQGNQRTINYTGRAAILTYGDVTVDSNLLACNNGDPNNTALSFPANNILGLMATNNMLVGASSQLSIMGAFYAANMIRTQRQTTILGTIVGNYFDMGTNVPRIFQVPTLADNLPVGMIGNFPIMVLQQVSWRELGA